MQERAELAAADDGAPVLETAVPDIRETSVADAAEHADPAQRHRVRTVDETAAAVARAQAALAEIEARRQFDDAHEREDARRDELIRWAERDRGAEAAAREHDNVPVRES